jgi:hypothetical protein
MRNISDKSCTENRNTHFMFSNVFRKPWRFLDNVETYGRDGQDRMAIQYGTCALHAGYLRLQTHTQDI